MISASPPEPVDETVMVLDSSYEKTQQSRSFPWSWIDVHASTRGASTSVREAPLLLERAIRVVAIWPEYKYTAVRLWPRASVCGGGMREAGPAGVDEMRGRRSTSTL
jgi:hypothetical protein